MIYFAIAVFLILLLPRLWAFGMFLDGLLYASIARNMAEGAGTFNAPYYTDFMGKIFYWHPPLSFWLHSLFYRFFGDNTLVDTLFGFVSGGVILALLFFIFQLSDDQKSDDTGKPYWSVILLVSLMPMTSWIFSNNMLEITMTVFILASVYFQLRALNAKTNLKLRSLTFYFLCAGVSLALAVLSKNIAGLFPLIVPMLHYILFKKTSFTKALLLSIFLTAAAILTTYLILYFTDSIDFYKNYIQHQLVPSVSGSMPGEKTGAARNTWLILSELLLPLVVSLSVTAISKKWNQIKVSRLSLFFLIIGLAGTVPLFLVHKFRSYYLYPGLPFFALSIAAIFAPSFLELDKKFKTSALFRRYTTILSFMTAITAVILFFSFKNYPSRLKEFKYDFYDTALNIPPRSAVANCVGSEQYTLIAAFQRYYKLSLVSETNPENSRWILNDKTQKCKVDKSCRKINRPDSLLYDLYDCKPEKEIIKTIKGEKPFP
ncbi:MAG: glycosyltransferase family 39 protein [Spirochaetia bacterium]|nr:glycosyltransferase family 39 protein [Spirochaetia bacterium]